MHRRKFIKLGSCLSLFPLLASSCEWSNTPITFDVFYSSDMEAGHLIFKSKNWEIKSVKKKLDYLIVGGGIAGLTAAHLLKDENFLLFELGKEIGGSSSAQQHKKTVFSQGAHYDWSYPNSYGKEVLQLFEKLDIIYFNEKEQFWNFKDKQYLINGQESQSLVNGNYHAEYLEEFADFQLFYSIIREYTNTMLLPTRLINQEIQELNKLTFLDFLHSKDLFPQPDFLRTLSYQLMDDYGAGVETISALAGIHYYMCRPYYSKKMKLFSPPQGNSYFTEKLKEGNLDKIKTQQVVKKITKQDNHFLVDIIDIQEKCIYQHRTDKIIYAGQKHALKYICPKQYHLFESTTYSPWVVVNIILKESMSTEGIWQNEFPLNEDNFMGFVDSQSQNKQEQQVLTCYYCFDPKERNELPKIQDNLQTFTRNTIEKLSIYLKTDISLNIEKVYVKSMGHAMPIPTKDYLFTDKNHQRPDNDFVFAGVDNARLPLLFEAVDSGIEAVKLLKSEDVHK